MRGFARPAAVALALSALLSACTEPASPPPATPTPAPTPTPMYPKTAYITLFEYPVAGGCRVVAIPYHAWVATGGDIVWDVVNDACPNAGDPQITFTDSGIVDLDAQPPVKKKTGKVRATDNKPHKYSVALGAFTHDPEIQIWP
jgi:hypothetical protein